MHPRPDRNGTHRPTLLRGSAAAATALTALLVGGLAPSPARAQDGQCPLASPAEVAEGFAGKLSVEVQEGSPTGCAFTISGRSFSFVRLQHISDGGDLVEGTRKMIEDGEVEGEVIDDLGVGAALTDNALKVDLADGSALTVSISVYGDTLNPLLEDEEKRAGLLAVGELVVERLLSASRADAAALYNVDGPVPTRRQEIVRMLEEGGWTFDELRETLGVSVATLASDLRHVERSLRQGSERLEMSPPRCAACDFELTPRPGRFTTPSRCPRCREERILPGRLSIG